MAKKKFTDLFVVDNVIQGTKGNDIFNIKSTDTNVRISSSKGSDVLYLQGVSQADAQNMKFEQGVDAEGHKTRDLVITTSDGRTITVENYFTNTSATATKSTLKTIRFEDSETGSWGSSVDGKVDVSILDMGVIDYKGTFAPKKKKVLGTAFNDEIDMSGENTKLTINGGAGNDVITGTALNDKIIGGKGNNTFIYNEGSGADVVQLTKGEYLTIKYVSEDATVGDFSIEEKGKDVVITRNYEKDGIPMSDSITVKNMTKNNLANSVIFELGSSADETDEVFDLRNDFYTIDNGKKKVTGTNLNEYLFGTTLNDTIKGQGGDDVIDGDVGNDKLYGGKGGDTFVFGTYELNGKFYGAGRDTVYDAEVFDTLQFTNSKAESLLFTKNKRDLVVTYFDKDDTGRKTVENTVTIKNYYDKKGTAVRAFQVKALDENGELVVCGDSETVASNAFKVAMAENRNAIDTAKAEADAANQAKIEAYEGLVSEIFKLKREQGDFESQLAAKEEERAAAQAKYDDAKAAYDEAAANLENYQSEHDALVSAKNKAEKDLADKTIEYNQVVGAYDVLAAEKEDLEGQLTQANNSITSLNSQITEKNTAISGLESDVSGLQTQVNGLNNTITEKNSAIETLTAEKDELTSQLSTATGNVEDLTNQIAEKNTAISGLESDVADLQTQVTNLNNTITEKNNAIETLTGEKSAIETQVTNLTSQVDTLSAQKTAVETQLQQANADKTQLEQDLEAMTTAKENADKALTDYKANHNHTDAEYLAWVNAKAQADSNLASYKTNHNFTDAEYQAKVDALSEATTALNNYQGEHSHSNSEYTALEQAKQAAVDDLNEFKETHNFDDTEYNALKTAKENADKALTDYQANHQHDDAAYNALLAAKEQAEDDLTTYQQTYTKTAEEYNQLAAEKEALEGQIEELQEQASAVQNATGNVVMGSSGNDNLAGSNNADLIIPNKGNDVITSADYANDKMMLSGDFDDVCYTKSGNDLTVYYQGGTVVLKNYYFNNGNLDTIVINNTEYKISDTLADKLYKVENIGESVSSLGSDPEKEMFVLNGGELDYYGSSNGYNSYGVIIGDKFKLSCNRADVTYGQAKDGSMIINYPDGTISIRDYFREQTPQFKQIQLVTDDAIFDIQSDFEAKGFSSFYGTQNNDSFEGTDSSETFVVNGGDDNIHYSSSEGYSQIAGDKIQLSCNRADINYTQESNNFEITFFIRHVVESACGNSTAVIVNY